MELENIQNKLQSSFILLQFICLYIFMLHNTTKSAKNLGYHLDSTLKNITHINKLCSSLSLTIRRICKFRPNINEETTRTLVQALITTWLDYCSSLLIGTPDYILHKLQCIQNSAARLVFNKKWVYHITPYLESLHWLKIKYGIRYKICMLMFKCVKGLALDYLCELVISNHNRNLRSSTANLLPVSKHKLSQVHNSSFKSVSLRLWNMLLHNLCTENDLMTFKSKLKNSIIYRMLQLVINYNTH